MTSGNRILPLATCLAYGGTWFREVTLHEFRPEAAGRYEAGPISRMPMTVLVCFCGIRLRPRLGGVRGGYTPNSELARFFANFDGLERLERVRQNLDWDELARRELVPNDDIREIRRIVSSLEKHVGRLLAPRTGDHIEKGGHWRLPRRSPASQGKGRDWLAIEIQKRGLTFDESRAAASAIFDSMTDALKAGERVETPLGVFSTKRRTQPYRRWRLGHLQTLHRSPKRIVFKPV